MARFCACLAPAPARAEDHLAAMGATRGKAPGLALVEGEPGHADGPFAAHGLTAVGEVTLHNRAELHAALAADGTPRRPTAPTANCCCAAGPGSANAESPWRRACSRSPSWTAPTSC